MTYTEIYTKEMQLLSFMRHENPMRYIQWREEDIEPMPKGEHTTHHLTGFKHSDEAKKKIGESGIGNTNTQGRKWFNDGTKSVMAYECPEGFVPGRIYERKKGA